VAIAGRRTRHPMKGGVDCCGVVCKTKDGRTSQRGTGRRRDEARVGI